VISAPEGMLLSVVQVCILCDGVGPASYCNFLMVFPCFFHDLFQRFCDRIGKRGISTESANPGRSIAYHNNAKPKVDSEGGSSVRHFPTTGRTTSHFSGHLRPPSRFVVFFEMLKVRSVGRYKVDFSVRLVIPDNHMNGIVIYVCNQDRWKRQIVKIRLYYFSMLNRTHDT
jgi:hypothetical protein